MADPGGSGDRLVWPVSVAWGALALATFRAGVRPEWHGRAACAGEPESMDGAHWRVPRAQRLCAGCPVRRECLADVLSWESANATRAANTVGTRAGLTATERGTLYRAFRGSIGHSGVQRRRPRA